MSYFFISAAHKSSGKTTLSIGLTAALRARGLIVQTYKKGPDYIDPIWLSAASGRPCRNLDFYTMPRREIEREFILSMQSADMGLIEGNKGLYDGLDLDGSNSNAALAALLQVPVLLVIDARGMTRGIAPLILGYQDFDPNIRIAGVILNKVGGSRHEGKLRNVIEYYTDVPVIGAVHYAKEMIIDERHLGLMPSNEFVRAQEKVGQMGASVAAQVDLDRLVKISANAPALPVLIEPLAEQKTETQVIIGYPCDSAFGFYYPGDLEKMMRAGAELISFDTLHTPHLPDVDGLFIGGGFPERSMQQLEANVTLRAEIKQFIERGGPVYAECGGLMYLANSITWQGTTCHMVGALSVDVIMHNKPQGRGYVRLAETGASPWPVLQEQPEFIAAHEFHYSSLEILDSGYDYAYQVQRGTGIDGEYDGIVYKNLLASYSHLRDVGGNGWTQRFISHVESQKGTSKSKDFCSSARRGAFEKRS